MGLILKRPKSEIYQSKVRFSLLYQNCLNFEKQILLKKNLYKSVRAYTGVQDQHFTMI